MGAVSAAGRVALWVGSIGLAFVFLVAGVPKLAGAEAHIRHFVVWGYPDWFRLVVGAIETASALSLLIPRLAFYGAIGIMVIMAGATYTHVIRVPAEAGRAPLTLGLLAAAAVVASARRPQR
jgi:putative oxidoreductase